MRNYFGEGKAVRFLFPIDGDCINSRDGFEISDRAVRIPVKIEAPEGHAIEVNGVRAHFENGVYRAYADIEYGDNLLTAKDATDGSATEIAVKRLPNAVGGFRFSVDDNIIFLKDLTEHKDEYTSIFDNPYLAVYKKAHEVSGVKVHLNLFYEFDDEARSLFSDAPSYFNLSMMTDKYKDEFRKNADWLKLSFHAKSEFPSAPYKHADGETVREHCEKVHAEIIRFAGEECLSRATTVHFGEANVEGVKALRSMGYRALTGYFIPDEFPVAYYAPDELIKYIHERDFWYDRETDITFGRIDRVVNLDTHEENLEILREVVSSPTRGGFVSIMIHEQYFYNTYENYLPDFEARVVESCKLVSDFGYEGRFITEAVGV